MRMGIRRSPTKFTRVYACGLLALTSSWAGFMTVAAGHELVLVATMPPLQTEGIGSALCELGLGRIITAALYIGSIALAYMGIGDLWKGFKRRKSKSAGKKGQAGDDFGNALFKMVGAVVIGGFPIIASAIGFDLLSCVEPIRIITG